MLSPSAILATQKAKVADLEAQLSQERFILKGMETMAGAMIPVPESLQGHENLAHESNGNRSGAGRKPGAISFEWREVLNELVGGLFTMNAVIATVKKKLDRDIRPFDATRRIEQFINHGYVEQKGTDYCVTENAVTKFGLKKPELPANLPLEEGSQVERAGEVDASLNQSQPGQSWVG